MRKTNTKFILTVDTRTGVRVKDDLAAERCWVVAVAGEVGLRTERRGRGWVRWGGVERGWGGSVLRCSYVTLLAISARHDASDCVIPTGTFWQRSLRRQAPLRASAAPLSAHRRPFSTSFPLRCGRVCVTTARSRAGPQLLLFVVVVVVVADVHFIASRSDRRHENGRPVTSRRAAVRDVISQVRWPFVLGFSDETRWWCVLCLVSYHAVVRSTSTNSTRTLHTR